MIKTDKLVDEMQKNHSELMEKLDYIDRLIRKVLKKKLMLYYQVSLHSKQLEDHEERVKTIEKPTI